MNRFEAVRRIVRCRSVMTITRYMRFAIPHFWAGISLLVIPFYNKASGKPIYKPFEINKVKFANPLIGFGKLANWFATLPLAKTALANFKLLNTLTLKYGLPLVGCG